ncbi:protein FAR1-RELATED SEQUENCE 5-like [Daucus carota subsp. sativus]|uniref:protein FAR1-RELATED SEQUENCE 5-like n=1 Tax=Daucus carota subsp. sativus TaxID=79200 RepID=UPI00308275DD
MASFIFSKLTSPSKPITPSKPRIEIEEENDSDAKKTPIVNVDDSDDDVEEVVEEVGDDDVEEVGGECFDDFCDKQNSKDDDLNESCPCVGQLFDSLDEAEMFYRDYGRRVGFEMIIRTTHRRVKSKRICSRLYICRKGGRIVTKSLDEEKDVHKKKRNRDSIGRTHCLARMYVVHREKLNKWEVTSVYLKHNHTMISKDEVLFMQRPRNITPVIRQLIITLNKSGIGPSKTLNVLGELTGGLENIGFGNQDVRNVLRDIRHYVFDSSDALEGLALLRELKRNSQGEFFYKVDVDEENRVRAMMWVDPRSVNAYKNFGDVVVFDSTYRTNRYCMPFVPFTRVNHHYQSILFGFSLIRDETEESYLWVFKSWLEAMGNVAPQTIITDQDIAIGNAIAEVLPNTSHLYCTWHISTKFGEKLSHLYANHDHFKEDFNSCIYKSLTVAQFEDRWEALVEKYDLMNHSWLQDMYSVRHKWVRVYTKLHFTTGMTTTSRSESMNSFFDEFVNASTGLKEFIENSQKALEKQYLREREADYETKNKERSKITSSSSLESHAASIYTKEMFRRFQHELKESGAYVVIERERNPIYKHYEAYKTTVQEEYRKHYVLFVTENGNITCVCRKFESSGMLCRHIIRYLYKMQWSEIPQQCITLRWTIEGNKRVGALQHKRPKIGNFLESQPARYSTLCKAFQDLAARGSCSIARYNYLMSVIEKESNFIENFPNESGEKRAREEEDDAHEVGDDDDDENFNDLRNPILSQTKGRKKERVKSGIERGKAKKGRKCNFCGAIDAQHDSRNCPTKLATNC